MTDDAKAAAGAAQSDVGAGTQDNRDVGAGTQDNRDVGQRTGDETENGAATNSNENGAPANENGAAATELNVSQRSLPISCPSAVSASPLTSVFAIDVIGVSAPSQVEAVVLTNTCSCARASVAPVTSDCR